MEQLLHYIQVVGYWGYLILFATIFLESFPLTFFFPGDSLLFTTGFLASQGYFNLILLILVYFLASVFGYIASYAFGKYVGHIVLQKDGFWWIKPKHIEKTHQFFEKYGVKAIVIGRFVPVVRSFSPALAGAGGMKYSKFSRYSLLGGGLWTGGLTLGGYYLGRIFPNAHIYLTPIIVAIVLVSLLPIFFDYISKNK